MSSTEIMLSVISITLMILLLIAGIVILFFQSGKQRLKQQMDLAQNKLNYEKELRLVETEVSEQMMSQFAQELHDNIGQLLTATHIHAENQKLRHPELIEGFKPMEACLAEAIQQLRMLSRTLNNDYIGRQGLMAAIGIEVNRIKSLQRFQLHWQAPSVNPHLDKNQELMLFRIFQESMQNSLRHSQAKNVYVSAYANNGNFEIKMQDDGRGFDVENILQSPKASGLRNIAKRAKWAGMDCSIDSSPGKGCTITLKKLSTIELLP